MTYVAHPAPPIERGTLPYRFEIGHVLLLDANVLWHRHLVGVLIACHHKRVLRLRWSRDIVDEAERTMRAEGLTNQARTLKAFLDFAGMGTLVAGYSVAIETLALPDPHDRHVLAAAISCGADAIVTNNVVDFPDQEVSEHALAVVTPDELLNAMLDNPDAAGALIAACSRQPLTTKDLLDKLERAAPQAAERLRSAMGY